MFEIQYCRIPHHYRLNFYWMAKNSYPILKNQFSSLHNQFFLFRGNNTNTIEEARFSLSYYHSLRSMAMVSLKVFPRGKPTTGRSLVLLYLMQISHFSSKSFIWDFSSSPFISQSCSKLNSLSKWVWKNCLWSFKPTLYFSILDKFCTLLQRNTTFDLNTF